MTLTGFKASNHPQQTAARGALDEVDDRGTDPAFVAELERRFMRPFTLDVAAAPHNAKAPRYFTRSEDGLSQSWADEFVWCNPPYSNLGDWLAKAWAEWPGTRGIVMLLPANRTEQKWWQEHVEPKRDRQAYPLTVQFLPGRMRFDRPGAVIGPKGDRPPFGCVLLVWREPVGRERPRKPGPRSKRVITWVGDEGTAPDGTKYIINVEGDRHEGRFYEPWVYVGEFPRNLPAQFHDQGWVTFDKAKQACERHYAAARERLDGSR
jgi:phage N-6-adenine-methyltransferase